MKKEYNFLASLHHYFTFFVIVAFAITCSLMLFVTILQQTLGFDFTRAQITAAAKLTFVNVLAISGLFTLIDGLRRRFLVTRPIRKIMDAAERISAGDFTARVPPIRGVLGEEMFNQIGECMNKMAEELSGVETLRTDFVANVSHELKTPLAVIQNYSTMLQAPGLTEAQRREYAASITTACRRLSRLITNILKLNKLENQHIRPTLTEYDLSEQLCDCLLQFEDAWERKNLNIEADLGENVKIRSDADLLAHVWTNLFSNAVKFTEPGGTVRVELTESPHHVTVRVSDTGCGMSPETGARIFDKFYQGDTSRATQGNGLGLALVKRVVEILRGEITVESVLGEGSEFSVRFRRN